MKIVWICDMAISEQALEKPAAFLRANGVELELLTDERLNSVKTITEFGIRAEQAGADSLEPAAGLLAAVADANIVITHVSPVPSAVIEAAPALKFVCVLRSGVENVALSACKAKGVGVINADGRNADAVADYTVALMIAEMRNIARGYHGLRQGEWLRKFDNVFFSHDMAKCTVGIIGAGNIGTKVIDRLKGFGSKVLVHDPYIADEQLVERGLSPVTLDELLAASDIISIHLRLSDSTAGFLSAREFGLMKPSAFLVNTARAGLVDEPALVEALKSHSIGGAALDVFEQEPLPSDSPLLFLDNATLTPHLAGTSIDSFENSVVIILEQLGMLLKGGRPSNLIG